MDQPLMLVFGGVVAVAILIGGFVQTGKRSLLYAAVAAGLLTLGLVGLERMTITPREAVKATLYVIADKLEQNDVDGVISHISAGRQNLVEQAQDRMRRVEILEVDIKRNLKIKLFSDKGMELAEAKFNVVFRGKDKRGFLDEKRPVPRFLTVRFKLEDGQWKVRDYEMSDPRDGIGT